MNMCCHGDDLDDVNHVQHLLARDHQRHEPTVMLDDIVSLSRDIHSFTNDIKSVSLEMAPYLQKMYEYDVKNGVRAQSSRATRRYELRACDVMSCRSGMSSTNMDYQTNYNRKIC